MLAGLLHDLGRVAVPNGIWDKPKPLVAAQWERVRLHTYYTERILARTPVFAGLATIAGAHHERLDGSGYHRGVGGDALSDEMRLLAVADAYVAMTNDRPHRAALTGEAAAVAAARRASTRGRLCGHAVAAVLEAAGQERAPAPAPPCGLTEREVEVLGLLAHGMTNKEIAGQPVPVGEDRPAPRRAHLRQDRPPHAGGGGDVRDGAPARQRHVALLRRAVLVAP